MIGSFTTAKFCLWAVTLKSGEFVRKLVFMYISNHFTLVKQELCSSKWREHSIVDCTILFISDMFVGTSFGISLLLSL